MKSSITTGKLRYDLTKHIPAYFKYHWNVTRVWFNFPYVGGCKIKGKRYKQYEEWREENKNESYDEFKYKIMHTFGITSGIAASVFFALNDDDTTLPGNIFLSSCATVLGYTVGLYNPVTIPAVGAIAIISVFHNESKKRLEAKKQKEREKERLAEKQRIEQWQEQKRKQWAEEFKVYLQKQIHLDQKPQYWSAEEYINMKIHLDKWDWERARNNSKFDRYTF